MCHGDKEKREMTNDGSNRTTKSRKNQNAQRKGNLRLFGNIKNRHHQTIRDERKKLRKKMRKLLETKLHNRNLIKEINTWAVPLVRYPGPFLKRTRRELQQMDQRKRKCGRRFITATRNNTDNTRIKRIKITRK